MAERLILHLDMDAFFASVEQRANPLLRGKPVLVCGNRSSRTVVATASYEARAFGVKTAMSLAEALRLCPQAVLVEGDPAKYLDTFLRVTQILACYSPELEVFSIDEAFVDLTDTADRFGGAWTVAQTIQQQVQAALGLPCSIGLGPNKLMAKLASSCKKPHGLTWIRQEEIAAVLKELPIEELCGIGEALRGQLYELGVVTCGQLAQIPLHHLIRRFGPHQGLSLMQLARGLDTRPVIPQEIAQAPKSMGHLQTLTHDTANRDVLAAVLLNLSEKVGRRLRQEGMAGRTVCLTVREADLTTHGHQRTLDRFLDDGYEIYQIGCRLLERLAPEQPVRMLGISVADLVDRERQLEWLPDVIRRRRLVHAADRINDRFGEGMLARASTHRFEEPTRHYQLKRYTASFLNRRTHDRRDSTTPGAVC